ncbi:hypothetical protein FVEN_g833 [Fusarium venenatum]|uniref:WSC domain-containing protein n=1 Tax=Fusarium venenatum TaxID=56646 RepID=A0A2L2TVE7_9HYPO|nr:uncharacterized protein FVRRES_10758 [Fusarium venenatum]KAG8361675.1 hypothetical protein FVEN_g833 [Fusarium venenatum]KAH6967338.1 hypothetical protein EDB82DRAFT_531021 [Fusarium venenatum]CEI70681.1 unnamed protein product [Fusarium venenatum]
MRVSLGLLLACASGAFGQFTRYSNTSTSAVETSTSPIEQTSSAGESTITGTTLTETTTTSLETTTSSSIPDSIDLDLRSFTLGQGCSFYPPPDGNEILFHPVRPDQTLDRRAALPFVPPPFIALARGPIPITIPWPSRSYSMINITITCNGSDCSRKIKRETRSPCRFQVLVDGEFVSAEPIVSSSQGTLSLRTNSFDTSSNLELRQSCGDESEIIDVVLNGVTLKRSLGATSRPIESINIDPETGFTTGTSQGATTNSEGDTVIPTATDGPEFTTNSEGQTVFPTDTNSEGAATNSEGETLFPTGTQTDDSTNSAGVTTNSQGETIVPTGTQTGDSTNSAGFTTNSEGETVFPTGTVTGTSPSSSSTSPAGFPSEVGIFTLFGCVRSTASFPTFELADSDGSMDLNACATLCNGRAYFGVYDTSCYCGDEIDAADTSRVDLDRCNIECPGDDTQTCGGDNRSDKLRVRRNVPNNQLLTVYVAAEAAVTVTDSITQTVTDQETVITTFTTTVTGATAITTQSVTATLVCFSGKCYSTSSNDVTVYIFVEVNSSECDGQWVYISEPCSCAGGQRYVPQFCTGGSCSGLKVYKAEECHDWYNYNSFFVASDCATCAEGKVVYLPWENSWGTPDNCNDDVPLCSGYDCPSKPNGGGSQNGGYPGDKGNSNSPHGGSHGGANGGSHEGSNEGSQGDSNRGSSPGSHGTPDGNSNGGSEGGSSSGSNSNPSGGSGSGSQGDSHGSNGSGSKGSETGGKPSTVPVVVSGASKQTTISFGLLALLAAFL